jgi:hypothetical protein
VSLSKKMAVMKTAVKTTGKAAVEAAVAVLLGLARWAV